MPQIYDILLYVIGGRYENSARQVYGFISGFMRPKKILIRFLRLGNPPAFLRPGLSRERRFNPPQIIVKFDN